MLLRSVSRTVFQPVPNVDSVLVVIERRGPAPARGVRALVHGAFAHRRKALARSLALAAAAGQAGLESAASREDVRAALVALGKPPDARAETLSPGEFVALADALGMGGSAA